MTEPPGKMKVAWVWFCLLILTRVSSAEDPPWETHGAMAGLEELFSDCELPEKTGSGTEFLSVPVWNFMEVSEGEDAPDSGRPQFGCSEVNLCVRLRLVRHSELRLEDGRNMSALLDKCDATVWTFGPWLFLKLPYSGCPVESWVSNGTSFHQLKLHYFDRLLQAHMTAVATCQDPAGRQKLAAPLVRCRATDVRVKLPLGTSLQRVEALAEDGVVGTAFDTVTTPDAVVVHISRAMDVDSFLEMTLLDSAGGMSTLLAVCLTAAQRPERHRRRRALHQPNPLGYWDFDLFPENYSPEGPECWEAGEESTTVTSCVAPTSLPWCVAPTSTPRCVDPRTTPPPPSCADPVTTPPPPSCANPGTTPPPPPCSDPGTTPPCSDPGTTPPCSEERTTPPCSDPGTTPPPPPCSDPGTTPPCSDPGTTPPCSNPGTTPPPPPCSDPGTTPPPPPCSDPGTTPPCSDPGTTPPPPPCSDPGTTPPPPPCSDPGTTPPPPPCSDPGTTPPPPPCSDPGTTPPCSDPGTTPPCSDPGTTPPPPSCSDVRTTTTPPSCSDLTSKPWRKPGWKRSTKPRHKPKPV